MADPQPRRRAPMGRRAAASLVVFASVLAACAAPEIPVITAPATPQPTAAPTPTSGPQSTTPTPAPFDGEPGVTATSIRIGVIADVDGAAELGAESQLSAWEAVEAWAGSVNADGGIAGGRMVEVVKIDSQVFRHAEAIDTVCKSDVFALVGSASLNDSDGLDQLRDPACGLPDFPAMTTTIERLRSGLTTVSNPIAGELWNGGWARFHADAAPSAAKAAAMLLFEFPTAIVNGERTIEVATEGGFDFVHRRQVSPQSDFETEAALLAESDARSLVWRNSGSRLIDLLGALGPDAADFRFIDCGQACYSRAWVDQAGRLGNGVSVWLPTVPFEDAELNRELLRYLLSLPGPEAIPTVTGVQAWAAGRLFERAVAIAIGEDTEAYDPALLTRASVIEAAATITEWDANGLHGVANPAAGIPSPCFTLLILDRGTWERIHPTERGAADCAAENLVALQFTNALGAAADAEAEPETTSTDSTGGDGDILGGDGVGEDPPG